ncbi:hypothetical protein MHY01S_12250 [Meiothermus hypogaeus NBRC 106114]|uniref:Uncharacterized protein n=1 Tax=Meiothermus hypogaeus NBRC 106114 TaxID=1227553 RepID=A0A511R0B3_9DEIN|nr:hypothetical protein MHY01S_12250 [Meiothermus hypogaeus NBRC 106114]
MTQVLQQLFQAPGHHPILRAIGQFALEGADEAGFDLFAGHGLLFQAYCIQADRAAFVALLVLRNALWPGNV